MGQRGTVRLSDALMQQVETAAAQRGVGVSDVMRKALQQFFDTPGTATGTSTPAVRMTEAPPSHELHDCAAAVFRRCIPETRKRIEESLELAGCSLESLMVRIVQSWVWHLDVCPLWDDEPPAPSGSCAPRYERKG